MSCSYVWLHCVVIFMYLCCSYSVALCSVLYWHCCWAILWYLRRSIMLSSTHKWRTFRWLTWRHTLRRGSYLTGRQTLSVATTSGGSCLKRRSQRTAKRTAKSKSNVDDEPSSQVSIAPVCVCVLRMIESIVLFLLRLTALVGQMSHRSRHTHHS